MVVRARDHDLATVAMHIGFPETEQLGLAKPGEERRCEDLPPDFLERVNTQEPVGFPCFQERRRPLWNLPPLHCRGRVWPAVLARLISRAERALQEAAQVV